MSDIIYALLFARRTAIFSRYDVPVAKMIPKELEKTHVFIAKMPPPIPAELAMVAPTADIRTAPG
jgi:hypothetical protein